jgi:nitroreductase
MELKQALRERRSIRKFTDRPVARELLDKLLKEALWAPSGTNTQPWKFVVLRGEPLQKLLRLSSALTDTIDAELKAKNFNEKMRTLVRGYFKNLGGAGTAVVCLSKTSTDSLDEHSNTVSCAAALYNFLLLAHEAGLATCWMTGYLRAEEQLLQLLGIQGYKLVGLTPVGYAAQTPPVPPRKHEDIIWMD